MIRYRTIQSGVYRRPVGLLEGGRPEPLFRMVRSHRQGFHQAAAMLADEAVASASSRLVSGACRRRGVVAVQVAVMLTVLLGFAALTIDVGAMYNAKGQLQRAADSAALASASMLSAYDLGDPIDLARIEAVEYITSNEVFGRTMVIDPLLDVTFGRAHYDADANSYTFTETTTQPDAVRVRVRHTSDSANGPFGLFFAAVLGRPHTDISVQATAIIVPRDIAVVADMSASHNDDSELRNYDDTTINLHEVWDDIPGGIDDDPADWAGYGYAPTDPQAAGPAWGYMKVLGYGTDPITSTYDPTSDAGLIQLRSGSNWTSGSLQTYLQTYQTVGYNSAEVSAIQSSSYDGSYWSNRAAVALGVARWNSGKSDGLWQRLGLTSGGNGDNRISSGELTFVETIGARSVSDSRTMWQNYIGYMRSSSTEMYDANSALRYRFGVKTFTNFLMEREPENSVTPELADTRHQPMQAVKDAVSQMVTILNDLDTDDRVSLEIYGETAVHEVDLTDDFDSISGRLNEMQAGYYDGWTNMGGGIQKGIEELTSVRARSASRKVIFLLTDGQANVTEDGDTGDYTGGKAYALEKAQEAADLGFYIFAVSVGSDADPVTMQQIADIGSGTHFYAEGSIEEYSEELLAIFESLGGQRPVELIE